MQHFPLRTQSPSRVAFSSDRRSVIVDEYNVSFKYQLETSAVVERFTERLAGRSMEGTHRFSSTVSNLVSPDGKQHSGKINEKERHIGTGVISGDGRFAAWVQDRYSDSARFSTKHIADLKSGEVIQRLWMPDNFWNTGDFSTDGNRIIVGAVEGMVAVFDVEIERLLFLHQSTAGAAKCVVISPDGNWVTAAFGHHSLRWWRIDGRADDVQFSRPLQRKIRASPEVESIFETFVDSVQQADTAKTEVVGQWRANLRDSSSEIQLLQLALRHADPEIKLATLQMFAIPANKKFGKVVLSDEVQSQLLNVVDNFTEELSVRREVVRTLLQSYESDRRQLYQRLSVLKSKAFFAISALAELVSDRESRQWMAAGAFDAAKGAVNLLGSRGTDASEAVPALALALDEHLNREDFAAEAARALGSMNKEAEQALPALRRATNSNDSTVRSAAETHQGEFGFHRVMFAALTQSDDIEISAALASMYCRFQELIRTRLESARQSESPVNGLSADDAAWALIGLATVSNVIRELELLKPRLREEMFAAVAKHVVYGTAD